MKVLLINDYSTPTGGAELLAISWRKKMRERGHDARLFTSSARSPLTINEADYECLGTLSKFRILLQTLNPWAWLKLRRVLADFQPDVVHIMVAFTQLSPLILPLLKDIPTLYNAQWYRIVCPTGTKILPTSEHCQFKPGSVCRQCLPLQDWLLIKLQMRLLHHWFKAINAVVAASCAVKERLIADGIECTHVVLNGTPICPRRPPLSSPPRVVFAGRLVWEKGVDVLLRAFAKVQQQVPEAMLLIAGDGPQREALEALCDELDLSDCVSFLGHLSRMELESRFASAWVQAVPSRWVEPFGLVAAEAHMRGTAAVVTGLGGLAEIVQHGKTGFWVPPNDADKLANSLTLILKDKRLAEKMGSASRKIAIENFSEDACVDSFLWVYQQLVSPTNSPTDETSSKSLSPA